ncbi:MAG TPA: hypothetical protein VGF65_12905 [Mycobacterium sp.]
MAARWRVLRPGMFMNNDAAEWSASIREDGKVSTAFPGALEVPIAPVDIGAAAVAALTAHRPGPTQRDGFWGQSGSAPGTESPCSPRC